VKSRIVGVITVPLVRNIFQNAIIFFRRFHIIAKKKTINFVISVCPSVRMEQLGSYWTDFHKL